MNDFSGIDPAIKAPQKFSKIALVAGLMALLSGCGAGGFGTLSGSLMDGYISGAKICIDLNGNGACDTSEPSATTGSKGSFTLTAPNGTDLSAVHLLAEIPASAIDDDKPGVAIGSPYKMLAPASTPQVVSPLTTVVSTHVKDGKTLSQAQVQARSDLGLPMDHDFSKDYVARADTGAHNVARMLASVLSESVGANAPSLQNLKAALGYAKPFASSAYAATDVTNIAKYAKASAQSYTVMDFSEQAAAVTPFGRLAATIVSAGPTGSNGKALKLTKSSEAESWAGATISLGGFNSVPALPIDPANAKLAVRIYSPAANQPIMVKIENAADSKQPAFESTVNTTTANDWETLVFDFTKANGYSSSVAIHKISIFPEFGLAGNGPNNNVTGKDYFVDDIKFLGGNKAASLVLADRYASYKGELWWWGGDFPDEIQSGYGFAKNADDQWGFGIYVKNGGSGWDITSATNYKVRLGTNVQCVGVCKVTLVLVSAVNASCKATALVTLTSKDLLEYSKPLADFAVEGCAVNSIDEFKKLKLTELHYQMLRANMQFTTTDHATHYPNGLGVGAGMKFD